MRLTHVTRSSLGITLAILLALASVAVASRADAVSVSILDVTSSAAGQGLAVGDTVTLDIGLTNAIGPVYGVGISVYGYDREVVEFVNVELAASFLNDVVMPDGTTHGGFTNHAKQPDYSDMPAGIAEMVRRGTPPSVNLFKGISLTPISGNGSLDSGIDGALTGDGGVHARVTFRLIGDGFTTLMIGSDPKSGAVVLDGGVRASASGTSIAIFAGLGSADAARVWSPVPEPGSALLLGMGLGVLAGVRSRG